MHFNNFVGLLLTLIAGQQVSSSFTDDKTCDFNSLPVRKVQLGKVDQFASVEWLRTCFQSLPFDSKSQEVRNRNVLAVEKAFEWFYSYKNLGQNSLHNDANPTPYTTFNVTHDFEKSIETIKTKEYGNAVDFHLDIQQAVNEFRDSHTVYVTPFNDIALLNTIMYTFETSDNGIVVKISPMQKDDGVENMYEKVYGVKYPLTNNHFQRPIRNINGVPAAEFITQLAHSSSTFKDIGASLNLFLKSPLKLLSHGLPCDKLETSSGCIEGTKFPLTHTYEFDNGEVASIKSVLVSLEYFKQQHYAPIKDGQSFLKLFYKSNQIDENEKIFEKLTHFLNDKKEQPPVGNFEQKLKFKRKRSPTVLTNRNLFGQQNGFAQYKCDMYTTDFCYELFEPSLPGEEIGILFKLNSFVYDPTDIFEAFREMAILSHNRNINKLLIDITKNEGGVIETAQALLKWLIKGWNDDKQESSVACSAFDFRLSEFWKEFIDLHLQSEPTEIEFESTWTAADEEGMQFLKTFYVDEDIMHVISQISNLKEPKEKRKALYKLLDQLIPGGVDNLKSTPVSHFRGGIEEMYTTQHYADCKKNARELYVDPNGKTFYWKDIRLISDAHCGSACSLFATKLWAHEKATIMTYGGINQNMTFSSYQGGIVENGNTFWHSVVLASSCAALATGKFDLLEKMSDLSLATAGFYSFNFREGYIHHRHLGSNPLPREFYQLPGDYYFPVWLNFSDYDNSQREIFRLANSQSLSKVKPGMEN